MTPLLRETRWQDDPEVPCSTTARFIEAAALVCEGEPGEALIGYAMLAAIGRNVPEGDVAAHARLRCDLAHARGERRLYPRRSA